MLNRSLSPLFTVSLAVALVAASASAEPGPEQRSPTWEIQPLAVDANEGIALADFNNDGLLDVVAGRNWYAAPAFVPRPVRAIDDWNGYAQTNGDFAYDVDQDGWTDVIAGGFTTPEVHWFRNPGAEGLTRGHLWEKRLLFDSACTANEANLLQDLDGDDMPEWIPNSWVTPAPMHVWRFHAAGRDAAIPLDAATPLTDRAPRMEKVVVSNQGNGHGLGVGDVNGDGLQDIICGTGWYECPGDETRYSQSWRFHEDWPATNFSVPVLVKDVDQDGRNDIIWGTAHGFGLQWWRQLSPAADGKTQWQSEIIDDTFSQAHALAFADLNGDGADDLITGKRVRAHNGKDAGGEMLPCLHYYSWDAAEQTFRKTVIDRGRVGIGLQIRTGDLNNDGRTDIAVAGKGGTFLLFNHE